MKHSSIGGIAAALAASLAGIAFAYEGPTFSATVWRGETAYIRVPDNLAGEMLPYGKPEGAVKVSFAYCDDVPYAPNVGGETRHARKDVLREIEPGAAARRAPTFCRVAVDESAKSGDYEFGPMKLRVIDRVLPQPKDWKYFLDLWQHPWAVARYFGVEPFSREHYERMVPVWRALAQSGCKALTVTLLDLPWNHQCYDAYHSMVGRVKKADGTWKFDYTLFDRYVAFGRRCGIGPDIACYTMCPWGYVVRWQDEKGNVCRATAKPGTPEFDDYWGAFLVDFAKHLKEKGWFDDAYIAMDERSPEDVKLIAAFVQAKAPGMKIAMAGNRSPSSFKGIVIDNYSQSLSHMADDLIPELASRREKGYKTTLYVCCSPGYPNTFMKSGDDEGFWIGAYPALAGFDGFLRWAANSWPMNPYEDATFGNWLPGDAYLVYPNGEMSARLVALRSGIVAAEKLRILREAGAVREKEVADLAAKYGYKAALGHKTRMDAFRRDLERLVSR